MHIFTVNLLQIVSLRGEFICHVNENGLFCRPCALVASDRIKGEARRRNNGKALVTALAKGQNRSVRSGHAVVPVLRRRAADFFSVVESPAFAAAFFLPDVFSGASV